MSLRNGHNGGSYEHGGISTLEYLLGASLVEQHPEPAPQPEEAPIADTSLGEILSPSQVTKFIACPASWAFRYVLGLEEAIDSNRALGLAIHKAAERYYRAKIEGRQLDLDQVNQAFVEEWKAIAAGPVMWGSDTPDALAAEGRGYVVKYMAEAAPTIEPAKAEVKIAGEIAGVKVRGIIDLLDVAGRVIDLKSSSKKPTDDARPTHTLQLATYRKLCPEASGAARIDTIVRTKTPQIVRQDYEVSEADLKMCDVLYPRLQAAMRSGIYWPNRSAFFCSRRKCSHWMACEAEYGGRVKA